MKAGIHNKIAKVYRKLSELNSCQDRVLKHILPYLPSDTSETNFWHIEHQPSDGVILADSYSNVYDLISMIKHIQQHGAIKEIKDLHTFRI